MLGAGGVLGRVARALDLQIRGPRVQVLLWPLVVFSVFELAVGVFLDLSIPSIIPPYLINLNTVVYVAWLWNGLGAIFPTDFIL